jgi:hypothetical protein
MMQATEAMPAAPRAQLASDPTRTQALPEDLLAAALRGEAVSFPEDAAADFASAVADLAQVHGVEALLHFTAAETDCLRHWPEALHKRFANTLRHQAIGEILAKRATVELLDSFAAEDVPAVLLKGTPLAYSLYQAPYLRTRGDTDILIPESHRKAAHRALQACGYQPGIPTARWFASYQLSYTRHHEKLPSQVVDLHWRLSNRQIFARLFAFDELWRASIPVPELGPGARTLRPTHALLLACTHRATHVAAPIVVAGQDYYEPNRLIWLYDIKLLSETLDANDWDVFADLAARKRVRRVCLDALQAARDRLGATVPKPVSAKLDVPASDEPSAAYLLPGKWLSRQLVELRAMSTRAERLGLMLDIAFPPAEHMLRKYNTERRWLVPALYVRRGMEALLRGGPSR